jgi:hypothetical protein
MSFDDAVMRLDTLKVYKDFEPSEKACKFAMANDIAFNLFNPNPTGIRLSKFNHFQSFFCLFQLFVCDEIACFLVVVLIG